MKYSWIHWEGITTSQNKPTNYFFQTSFWVGAGDVSTFTSYNDFVLSQRWTVSAWVSGGKDTRTSVTPSPCTEDWGRGDQRETLWLEISGQRQPQGVIPTQTVFVLHLYQRLFGEWLGGTGMNLGDNPVNEWTILHK